MTMLALAWFGAGLFLAQPTESVAHRDAAVSLELDYEWAHALAGVTVLGTPGFANLQTSFIAGRGDFILLSGPVTPFVGVAAGLFGQALHCPPDANCNYSKSDLGTMLEAGVLLRKADAIRVILSVAALGPLTRTQPAVYPPAPATPIPLWLVGLRVLG